MSNISDIIEGFILEQLAEFNELNLSRNDLADYFKVAPSQINYVLSTRFTYPRGFVVESRRGGGGYIKLTRLNMKSNDLINYINKTLNSGIDYLSGVQLLDNFKEKGYITDKESNLIKSAITDKALKTPINNSDTLRANILREVLIHIFKEEN